MWPLDPRFREDDTGGRVGGHAQKQLGAEHVIALGTNAVIGTDIDYETVGKNGSMLIVSVSGTAATILGTWFQPLKQGGITVRFY